MIIALDGPSGSGKSSVSRALAKRLGVHYVDTGAMYRAFSVAVLDSGIATDDEPALTELANTFPLRVDTDRPGRFSLWLGDRDISEAIRTPEIDNVVSLTARVAGVRRAMVRRQRAMAAKGSLVIEGRDITTVVFPNADFKFYLDADPNVRAERRFRESEKRGFDISLQKVAADQEKRDTLDRSRAESPLAVAPDAVRIDTTNRTEDEVVLDILRLTNVGTERFRWFYAFCRSFLWLLFKLFFRLSVSGRAHIPKRGGFIVAANHRSFLDPPLVAVALNRQVSFMARDSLFSNRFFSALIRSLRAHPIRRASADRSALRLATGLIRAGNPVLMFPEGTRSADDTFLTPRGGLGYLAARLGCPVLPLYIKGSYEAYPKGARNLRAVPISISIGSPILFEPGKDNLSKVDTYLIYTNKVMDAIKDLNK